MQVLKLFRRAGHVVQIVSNGLPTFQFECRVRLTREQAVKLGIPRKAWVADPTSWTTIQGAKNSADEIIESLHRELARRGALGTRRSHLDALRTARFACPAR